MTLNQSVRHPFARALANLRDGWDFAGVEAAMVKASQNCADDAAVLRLALETALDHSARLPEAMNVPRTTLKTVAPISTPPTPTPASLTVWCERHGCNAKERTDGELSCCWQERIEARTPGRDLPPIFTRTPAPENFWDLVAAARASRDDQGDET